MKGSRRKKLILKKESISNLTKSMQLNVFGGLNSRELYGCSISWVIIECMQPSDKDCYEDDMEPNFM